MVMGILLENVIALEIMSQIMQKNELDLFLLKVNFFQCCPSFSSKLSWSISLVVVEYTTLLSVCVSKTGIPERTDIISCNWMTKCSFWPLFHLQPLPLLCRDIVSKFQVSVCEQHLPKAKSIGLPTRHRNLSGESGPLICMKAAPPSQRLKETETNT